MTVSAFVSHAHTPARLACFPQVQLMCMNSWLKWGPFTFIGAHRGARTVVLEDDQTVCTTSMQKRHGGCSFGAESRSRISNDGVWATMQGDACREQRAGAVVGRLCIPSLTTTRTTTLTDPSTTLTLLPLDIYRILRDTLSLGRLRYLGYDCLDHPGDRGGPTKKCWELIKST